MPRDQTICNLAIVPASATSAINLFTQSGTHLIVDVLGWFPTGSAYRSISPERIVDTRRDQGLPGPLDPAETLTLDLPDEPIGALVVNITSTAATERSFLTAWPWGVTRPLASNLTSPRVGLAPMCSWLWHSRHNASRLPQSRDMDGSPMLAGVR